MWLCKHPALRRNNFTYREHLGWGGQHSHLIWRFNSKNTTSPTMLGILTMMLSASALMAGLALGKRKQEAHLVFDACTG